MAARKIIRFIGRPVVRREWGRARPDVILSQGGSSVKRRSHSTGGGLVSIKGSASAGPMPGHAHHHDDFTRAFAIGIAINIAIVAIELVFGILANSMALISDAGHNMSDVLGLVVGWAGSV